MNNKIYADRLNEQYSKLSDLMSNIPTEIDKKHKTSSIDKDMCMNSGLCNVWEFIRSILIGRPCSEVDGILNEISCILKDILADNEIKNCALKAELQRGLKLINYIIKTLQDIDCSEHCEKLIGKLFCLLVRLILILLALIAKVIILLVVCRDYDTNCDDVRVGFCRCLIDDLSKEINDLCVLLDSFKCIAIEFKKCEESRKTSCCKCECNKPCECKKSCECNRSCECDRPCECKKSCGCR